MPIQNDLHLVVITICSTAIMTLAYVVLSRQRASSTLVVHEETVNRLQHHMNNLRATVKDLTDVVNRLSEDVAASQIPSPSLCSINSRSDDDRFSEPKSRISSIESSECEGFVLVPRPWDTEDEYEL
jgi:hypothetical protein